MEQIIFAVIYLIVAVVAFFLGKYIKPALLNSETITAISAWVYKFVVSAKNQYKDGEGDAKRAYVTQLIKQLADQIGIKLTDEQIRALIEDAYTIMKQEEKKQVVIHHSC